MTGSEVLSRDCQHAARAERGLHTVHENINKQDLHRVERVTQTKERAERDQRQRARRRAQLEREEVLNIMED